MLLRVMVALKCLLTRFEWLTETAQKSQPKEVKKTKAKLMAGGSDLFSEIGQNKCSSPTPTSTNFHGFVPKIVSFKVLQCQMKRRKGPFTSALSTNND